MDSKSKQIKEELAWDSHVQQASNLIQSIREFTLFDLFTLGIHLNLHLTGKSQLIWWFWTLDTGPWNLDPGCCTPDVGLWTLGSGRWTLDSGFWTLDSGRWALDAGFWTLDPGHWTLDTGPWTLDAAWWTLEAGPWTVDFGRWTLDATLWMLGSGHWTLLLTVSEQSQNPVSDSAWLNYWKFFGCKSLRTSWWHWHLFCRDYRFWRGYF